MDNKIIRYVKENKKQVIVAVIIVAFLLLTCIQSLRYNISVDKVAFGYEQNSCIIGGLFDGVTAEQRFTYDKNCISGFSLRFATYGRECQGNIRVELIEDPLGEAVVLFSESFAASDIADTQFRKFSFAEIKDVGGKMLSVKIVGEGAGELPATIWASSDDAIENAVFYLNGQDTGMDLNIVVYGNGWIEIGDFFTVFLFAVLVFAVLFMMKRKMLFFKDNASLNYIRIPVLILAYILLISTPSAYAQEGSIAYRLNAPSLISLAVLLLLCAVFEKRLGLYSFCYGFFKKKYNHMKAVLSEEKHIAYKSVRLFVSSVSYISTSVLLVSVTVFLMLNVLTPQTVYLTFVLAFLSCISFIIDKTVFEKNTSVAALFLFVCLMLGIFLSYAMPTGTDTVWDEHIHYDRVTDIRNMLTGKDNSLFDENMEMVNVYTVKSFLENSREFVYNITADYNAAGTLQKSESVDLYKFVGYIPAAVMLAIAELLSMSVIPAISLAQFVNVIFYAFPIYFGIKRLRSGKFIFSAVALIPTAMFIAAGFNYDFMVTSFIMYSLAVFISELQAPWHKISCDDVFLMLFALLIGCGSKMIYFAMGIPFLFLGSEKFENKHTRKKYILACVAVMAVIFVSFAIPFLIDTGTAGDIRGGTDVNSGEQLKFIFGNLFKYVGILFSFLLDQYGSLKNLVSQTTFFAYMGHASELCGTITALVILYCAFTDKHEPKYRGRGRNSLVGVITCVIQMALVATALYLSFTPVGYPTVNGCQYRYIFPVLASLIYFISPFGVKKEGSEKYKKLTVFMLLAFVGFMSFYDIYVFKVMSLW